MALLDLQTLQAEQHDADAPGVNSCASHHCGGGSYLSLLIC
jgi:hypothetical protein